MTDLLKDTGLFAHLEGWMLANKPDTTLTIRNVEKTELVTDRGRAEKWALVFQESPKTLLLNKTNTKRLIQGLGPDTDHWNGARVTLYAQAMKVSGEPTFGVRIRGIEKAAPKEPGKKRAAAATQQAELDQVNKDLFG